MKIFVKSKEMKADLISSINAAYTVEEIESILAKTEIRRTLNLNKIYF